jgi:putative intracellular protease/amidase
MAEQSSQSTVIRNKGKKNMKILMVQTSHCQLGNTGRKTGFWLEEFAAPYFVFRDAGVELTLASPKRGQPPIDPKSHLPENQTPAMTRLKQDTAAQQQLSHTVKLCDMKSEDFDTTFYLGDYGPMWDLVDNPDPIALIESFYNSGKPVAAVCHSPAVFHRVMYRGEPLGKGKPVTGFTNGEEAAVNLTHVAPFLVEDELKRIGGLYVVTGQNPPSSTAAAQALMELLAARKALRRYSALGR